MKPLRALLVSLLLISLNATSQQLAPAIIWQKCLGGTLDDAANDIVKTPDGGFIVVGSSKSNNGDVSGHHGATTTTDAWVVKISSTGSIEWQRSLGGSSDDVFYNVLPAPGGGYLCHGVTASTDGDVTGNHGDYDIWLVKLDRYGNIVWQRSYGGSGREYTFGPYQTAGNVRAINGFYYLIGSTASNNGDVSGNHGGQSDIWLVKLDMQGNIIWQHCFGGPGMDAGFDVAAAESGRLLIAVENASISGDFGGGGGNPPRGVVVKIDSNFNMVSKDGIGSDRANPYSIISQGGRNFYTVHLMNCYPINPNSGLRLAYDDNRVPSVLDIRVLATFATCQGNVTLPNFTYDTYGAGNTQVLPGGDILLSGMTTDTVGGSHGGNDGFISMVKSNGQPGWRKSLGGSGADEFTGVESTSETEIILAGRTKSNNGDVSGNHGGYDVWIVKLGNVNRIKGTVFFDYNLNGSKDANEPAVNNLLVESQKNTVKAGSPTFNGIFSNSVDTGTYETRIITPYAYYTPVPVSKTSVFTSYNNVDSFSFALQPVPGNRDYQVSLLSTSFARAGFDATYRIAYTNVGTDTLLNRPLKLVKDSRESFISASVAPGSMIADTLVWNIGSLAPRQIGYIDIRLHIAPPPAVNNNDILNLSATIDTAGDLAKANNLAILRQTITGSFDPNDKIESLGGNMTTAELSGALTYTIRFQNTGNDTAFTVVIKDTLDAKLDWNTIEMVSASHNYELSTRNGNILTWTFNNILLVDSNHNEPASHGYVTYRIKPKPTLVVGDIIRNSASIYFDFNLPVKTNTQETTIRPAIIVQQPSVSGIAATYCSVQGVQKGKINNLPAQQGITTTVKMDGNAIAIAADSTFSFDVSAAGQHAIDIIYASVSETKTATVNFTVTAAVTPDVNVAANNTTITNLNDAVVITASGNGAGYTFAKDRSFTDILQAESANNVFNTTGNSLQTGDNWFYVRLKTNATCFTKQFDTDSIKIVLQLAAPDAPVIAGVKNEYCINEGVQKFKLTNYPAAGTGTTVTVKLDGNAVPLVMADTSFIFTPSAGNHAIEVSYANPTATKTTTANFTVNAAVTPAVDLSASSTTVTDGQVAITATNTGGGTTPAYLFAADRNFTIFIRPESTNGILTLHVSTMKLGENKIYVRMKTSATCYSVQTAIDSITITKTTASGLTDPDFPGQRISANPNPFKSRILVNGLSATKAYTIIVYNPQGSVITRRNITGSSSATLYVPGYSTGAYTLGIYDETKKRLIGNLQVVKQ